MSDKQQMSDRADSTADVATHWRHDGGTLEIGDCRDNQSGTSGVTFDRQTGRWRFGLVAVATARVFHCGGRRWWRENTESVWKPAERCRPAFTAVRIPAVRSAGGPEAARLVQSWQGGETNEIRCHSCLLWFQYASKPWLAVGQCDVTVRLPWGWWQWTPLACLIYLP